MRPAPQSPTSSRLSWIELIKATALIWIFINHISERLFGNPLIANPASDWPPLAERLAQLAPLHGYGAWNIAVNLLRYIGWSGDQGVQLFLIASGFSLTWSLLQRRTSQLRPRAFFSARALRLYPTWWALHFVAFAAAIAAGHEEQVTGLRFALSFIGVRVTPDTLYFIVPAWWYFTCVLQLYLLFPLLWGWLRRFGAPKFLIGACVVGWTLRAYGLLSFGEWIDAWSRGAIALTRLPEFAFGMALAALELERPALSTLLRTPKVLLACITLYALATALSLTFAGMSVAPSLLGATLWVLLYTCFNPFEESVAVPVRCGRWIGRHSYALYLVHQPILSLLVPRGIDAAPPLRFIAGGVAALAMSVVAASILETGVGIAFRRLRRRSSLFIWDLACLALGVALLFAGCLWSERYVEQHDPQEVFGWGERPSLQPDALFGWNLIPSRTTRLRWESYDYAVTANSLGFPGPEYPTRRTANSVRILTVGDAFTSAEGVDTFDAWPRWLERDLTQQLPGRKVEVLNFAITGYGPNQYAAVVDRFAPQYHPDIIVVAAFVNDFEDVLVSNEEFRERIGFGRPAADGDRAFWTLAHLRRWVQLHGTERLYERVTGRPAPNGYFLGQFEALERDADRGAVEKSDRQMHERLEQIADAAKREGAKVLLLMIPAPAQVCDASQLAYYPRNLDVHDKQRFDVDRPQRRLATIAAQIDLTADDLRSSLTQATQCPYQTHNLHWTVAGHKLVAATVSRLLIDQRFIERSAETVPHA